MVITRWLVRPRSTAGTCVVEQGSWRYTSDDGRGARTMGAAGVRDSWLHKASRAVHQVIASIHSPERCKCGSPRRVRARGCACCPGCWRSVRSSGPRARSPALQFGVARQELWVGTYNTHSPCQPPRGRGRVVGGVACCPETGRTGTDSCNPPTHQPTQRQVVHALIHQPLVVKGTAR